MNHQHNAGNGPRIPSAESANLEERIHVNTPFRSRGEAKVANMLDRYGIPFIYEQPTIIHDRGRWRAWRPDFTLPDYNNLILEYAGMMDNPDYAKGIAHKRRAYRRNNLPALFIYPRQIRSRDWEKRLYERIQYTANQSSYSAPIKPYSSKPIY
jgi:hypothetical protein